MHSRELVICAVLIGFLAALARIAPDRLHDRWRAFECGLGKLARHRTLCWAGMGVLVLLVRAVLLTAWPVPSPSVYDEFSYLLQADTFAHGRLANSAHQLWQFFESPYILQQPTYASRFPPGPALAMAAGQVFFGHPWFGVWLSAAVLAAVLCWALQAWLPPGWALFGSVIGLPLCLFSYWMNSYWGGAVAAMGGALLIGAWARIKRGRQPLYAWHFGIGAVILVLARPFEGLLLLVLALIALAMANRAPRVWLPIVFIGVTGASWLAYDNYRVTGHPLRLPYQEYYQQYETVPPFSIMPISKTPRRHFDLEPRMRETYHRVRGWGLLVDRPLDWLVLLQIYYGNLIWLFPLVAFAPALWHSKRTRFPAALVLIIGAASLIEVWWYPHYGAPFTAVLLLLAAQSLRYLRHWKYDGWEAGRFLVSAMPVAVLALMIASEGKAIATRRMGDQFHAKSGQKESVEKELLEKHPGQHVIFVHFTGDPNSYRAWIYNPADIDAASVIWARDLGEPENDKLRSYYAGRSFWLFKPNESMNLTPY